MSGKLWHEEFCQRMAELRTTHVRLRVSVVGIGHALRGDDSAGLALAQLLNERHRHDGLLVIEAGPAPENCLGLLFQFRPDLVLFVDAAEMGAEPGAVRLLDWGSIKAGSAVRLNVSTHTVPLPFVAGFVARELGCPVWLLGIQPERTTIGESLSAPVAQAVETTARVLAELLSVPQGAAVL
jgi:hydrogenase maturation protease HycI